MKYEFPTFLSKLSKRIEAQKKDEIKYVVVGSGTVWQINKEILQQYPAQERSEGIRNLNYDWAEGRQTLNGLKALIKEHCLIYDLLNPEKVIEQAQYDLDHLSRFLIVPNAIKKELQSKINLLTVISRENCLFID